jgi:hypothetical protein
VLHKVNGDTPYKNMLASGAISGPVKPRQEISLRYLYLLLCVALFLTALAVMVTAPLWLNPI